MSDSATESVTSYGCVINGTRFILVDTPGFNDTYRDENAILREIADWMTKTYASGKLLIGLVYLHPINNNTNRRLGGHQLACLQKALRRRLLQARLSVLDILGRH